jgi:chorismate mutase/prephenate dehydratase
MNMDTNTKDLKEIRDNIDQLDVKILELLNERAACALKLAERKREAGLPIYDPAREREILDRFGEKSTGKLPPVFARRIFSEIISACRTLQEPISIVFLGPEDTFSHMAALKHFGQSAGYLPRASIGDVFREVEHGRADFGVVPAENSINGVVGLTLDEWIGSDLKICGEILLPVSHVLMSVSRDIRKITKVFSHPQALGQCREWLAGNLPRAELVETSSTAEAARLALEDAAAAAVGAELLAERRGLYVLARNIQDRAVNLTRFFVLGRLHCIPTGRDRTSLLFTLRHQPGSLHQALAPLAEAGVNLTRIESRPTRERAWEYVFFIDIEGHQSENYVRAALTDFQSRVDRCKILGSYPAARADQEPLVDQDTDLARLAEWGRLTPGQSDQG